MVQSTERFKAFVKLGAFLRDYTDRWDEGAPSAHSSTGWHRKLREKIESAELQNKWFTPGNIRTALRSWGEALGEEHLERWVSGYKIAEGDPKKVAIIMAGNIPLVGLHDLLSVLITGNTALVKPSSDDSILLPFLAGFLAAEAPGLGKSIVFTDKALKGFDAVIATGSDNTARYFEYYFGRWPHIIRKNRNSVGILTGDESPAELESLGKDIFTYFGLGCRNVAKLYVPENYGFDAFFSAMARYSDVSGHRKYANNYDYNKAVYLMSNYRFLDNGFILLRENPSYASPIGTLNFERYNSLSGLRERIVNDGNLIQCVVGKEETGAQTRFGLSQFPALWEYADGVDTVDFLLKT